MTGSANNTNLSSVPSLRKTGSDSAHVITLIDAFSFEPAGGAGRVMFEVAKRIASTSARVSIVCRRRKDLPVRGEIEGVQFLTYRANPDNPLSLLLTGYRSFQNRVRKLLTEHGKNPVLIHAHHGFPVRALKSLIKKRFIPLLFTFHSPWPDEHSTRSSNGEVRNLDRYTPLQFRSWIRKKIEGQALQISDRIHCLSRYMKNRLLQLYNLPEDRIRINPGGVDINKFYRVSEETEQNIRNRLQVSRNKFVILTVRSLIPRTGIDNLIEAFAPLARKYDDIELHIGGSGPEEDSLKTLCNELDIKQRVRFLGYVPEHELADRYRACDLFMLPTRSLEGFGLVTLEAMACGKPVLATPVGGIPEILKPFSKDLLLESNSSESIRKGLDYFLKNRSELKHLGREGSEYVRENFGWARHTEQVLQTLQTLLRQT